MNEFQSRSLDCVLNKEFISRRIELFSSLTMQARAFVAAVDVSELRGYEDR